MVQRRQSPSVKCWSARLAPALCIAWAVSLSIVTDVISGSFAMGAAQDVDAITFAEERGAFYLTIEEVEHLLQWPVERDAKGRCSRFNGILLPGASLRHLTDGTELVSVDDMVKLGGKLAPRDEGDRVSIAVGDRTLTMIAGAKHVEVSLAAQDLRAWQGSRLVLHSRISSGRHGSTPTGEFTAGPYKSRMHYSTLFNNAPMPWSVQIHGHVFIHGFTFVPSHPASHGCIRLPLDEGNPAKFFFEWIDVGTPVRVVAK